MTSITKQQSLIFAGLAALMLATRFHHFGDVFHMPDASLAIFFVAGFYLRRAGFFAVLAAEAVLIDYFAINFAGVSGWCVSQAYGFLALSYLVAWAGGYVCHRGYEHTAAFALRFAATALAATSLGFVIANSSFYWLSGQIAGPSWIGFASQMSVYFPPFVGAACAYIAAAAAMHAMSGLGAFSRRPAA